MRTASPPAELPVLCLDVARPAVELLSSKDTARCSLPDRLKWGEYIKLRHRQDWYVEDWRQGGILLNSRNDLVDLYCRRDEQLEEDRSLLNESAAPMPTIWNKHHEDCCTMTPYDLNEILFLVSRSSLAKNFTVRAISTCREANGYLQRQLSSIVLIDNPKFHSHTKHINTKISTSHIYVEAQFKFQSY